MRKRERGWEKNEHEKIKNRITDFYYFVYLAFFYLIFYVLFVVVIIVVVVSNGKIKLKQLTSLWNTKKINRHEQQNNNRIKAA